MPFLPFIRCDTCETEIGAPQGGDAFAGDACMDPDCDGTYEKITKHVDPTEGTR